MNSCGTCRWCEDEDTGFIWCEAHECYMSLDVLNKDMAGCKEYSKTGGSGILKKKDKK